jgi:hypothetical protein
LEAIKDEKFNHIENKNEDLLEELAELETECNSLV